MTSHREKSAVRRAARVLALVPALFVTSATGAAFAEAPATWEDNAAVSPLHVILVLAVIPIGLFVLITLLVYLPSMSRGESYQPGQVWRSEPSWFGGPRRGVDSVDGNDEQPAVGRGGSGSTRGGASGHW